MEEKNRNTPKVITVIALAVMAVLLIISLVKIHDLEAANRDLRGQIMRCTSDIQNLRFSISAIYANVDKQLKEEASLISAMDSDIRGFRPDGKAASIYLSIVPKVLTDDMTVRVSAAGQTVELTRNGSTFTGTMDVGLFLSEEESPLMTIESNGQTQTEVLEDVRLSHLFEKLLPRLFTSMGGTSRYSNGKLTADMDLSMDVKESDSGVTFTSFTIMEEIDGREIRREDITAAVTQSDGKYNVEYNKQFDIAQGSTLLVYLIAKDSLGYTHKTQVWGWYRNGDGANADMVMVSDSEQIYDTDGTLLFPAASE